MGAVRIADFEHLTFIIKVNPFVFQGLFQVVYVQNAELVIGSGGLYCGNGILDRLVCVYDIFHESLP